MIAVVTPVEDGRGDLFSRCTLLSTFPDCCNIIYMNIYYCKITNTSFS